LRRLPAYGIIGSMSSLTTPLPEPDRRDRLAHYLLKSLNKGQRRYRLLADGDLILVAVSGGKDSLSMLDLLERRRRTGQERYSLIAAHIVSDYHCGRKVPDDWLEAWCAEKGIPLVMEPIEVAEDVTAAERSRCFRCARGRRKALFEIAGRMGCNKLAFGHHADDVAETTLMNLFYSGRIDSIDPKAEFFQGRLTVIRPLILIEERDIVPFARASGFPIEGEPCPDGKASRRAFVKGLLRQVEREHHGVKRSMYHAMDRYRHALARVGRDPKSI
jgi:tRNA(Ile)-lysidine synthase TilS/MesJ